MAKFKNDKGLTLIELLITIAVLAVVSAIALPVINNVVSSSNSNAAAQTQSDVDDFINKYSKSGVVAYDELTKTLKGYIDTDGDNTVDQNELIDTLTLDSKYPLTVTGANPVTGASYSSGGITSAVSDPKFAALAAFGFSLGQEPGYYSNILLVKHNASYESCLSGGFTGYSVNAQYKRSVDTEWISEVFEYATPACGGSFIEIGRNGEEQNYSGRLDPGTSYDIRVQFVSPSQALSAWQSGGTYTTGTGSGK